MSAKRAGTPIPTVEDAERAVKTLLQYIGEDPNRPGLKDTPCRVVNSLEEMCIGMIEDPLKHFKTFEGENYNQMIVVPNLRFTSLCEHHLLPFVGVAHIAYIPDGPIIGLSKLARVVRTFSKRLQVQERLTQQICETVHNNIPNCAGAGCVVESHHSCMSCRGVEQQDALMVTTSLAGAFEEHPVREEFFLAIARNKR